MIKYIKYVLGVKYIKCTKCKTPFKTKTTEPLCYNCQIKELEYYGNKI